MPTRHLSDEQRQRYANFTTAPSHDQLARYFHLDRSDREITDGLRGDHNRLGFALMLGSARFLGVFPGVDLEIPDSVTAFLVSQLGLKGMPSLKGYFDLGGQRKRHLALIRDNWPDVIRLAGSLKLGHLKAAGIMRMLQVRDKPTTLARALSEIGRIAKTVHILHYVDDAAFRRRILTQLNHTELRHRLGRRIHHGERGEIRSPLQQGQEEQLGCLGLALNAVVHWNAIYMQEAIRQIRANGMNVSDHDIAHLSPLIWRHLSFLGRYDFSLPDTVMNGGLRPLRNPTSAWDF
jgi:TnpA family transposase